MYLHIVAVIIKLRVDGEGDVYAVKVTILRKRCKILQRCRRYGAVTVRSDV